MNKVKTLLAKNGETTVSKSGNVILKSGKQYITLVKGNTVTKAGQAYQQETNTDPKITIMDGATPYKKDKAGRTEYIETRFGPKALRIWNTVEKKYRYTQLGKTYYNTAREEVIVHMPVRIEGRRKDGSTYRIFGHLPVDIPGLVEGPDMKQQVFEHYGIDADGGVVSIQSDEMWFYDPSGEWQVSKMTTEAGQIPDVTLHRPLQGDGMCVPRGIATALNLNIEYVCKLLDDMGDWRETGVPSTWVFELAEKFGVTACALFQGEVLKVQKPSKRSHRKALCWSIEGNHAVFHETIKGMMKRKPKRRRLKKDTRKTNKEISRFTEVQPGYFFSTKVDDIRAEFGGEISVSEPHHISTLRIKTKKGLCVIKSYPEDYEKINQWYENLNMKYTGAPLATSAANAFLRLLKAKRRILNAQKKEEIRQTQNNKCAMCDETLKEAEYDHIIPLSHSICEQEFRCLCLECHREATAHMGLPSNPLESQFEKSVWDAYVKSPKPKQLVFNIHEAEGESYIIDVVRCRRNALFFSAFPIPIFSIFDRIEKANNQLFDLNFIDKDVCWTAASVMRMIPYTGKAWYHRNVAEYLLHTGRIKWEHILYGINASAHYPPNIFQNALQKMDAAWDGIEDGDVYKKRSINSLIGTWASNKDSWVAKTSYSNENDIGDFHCYSVSEMKDGRKIYDYYYRIEVCTGGCTMRVMNQLALDTEHLRVGQCLDAVRKAAVLPRQIVCIKTDGIEVRPAKKRVKSIMGIGETTFRQLKRPRTLRMGVTSTESDQKVFRVTKESKPLIGNFQLPVREAAKPTLEAYEWKELNKTDAWAALLKGESLGVFGLPGCGKSTVVKEFMEQQPGMAITKTHTAASILNGKTIDWFCRRFVRNGSYTGTLYVDEISQVESRLLAELYKLVYMNVQTVIIGDFHQMYPVSGHSWKGTKLQDEIVQDSVALWRLCGGQFLELKENMRSDQILFDYYSKLLDKPLDIEHAKRTFPRQDGHPKWSLVIPHRLRIKINGVQNKFEKPKDAVFIEKVKCAGPNKGQNMFIYPGQVLRSTVTRKPISNGCFYKIKEIGEEVDFGDFKISKEYLAKHFRLSHAICIASAQGYSLDGRVRIYSHPRLSSRHLLVALSRATHHSLVEVV